jgi:hypothetical protein
MSSRKGYVVDVSNDAKYDEVTALTIYMSHDQAKLLRALLSQGTFASDGEAAGVFRKIKNSLAHVQDWKKDVDAQGARVTPKPAIPATPGTVFKARVERTFEVYEGDVFVAQFGSSVLYVTPTPVGGALTHDMARITRVF